MQRMYKSVCQQFRRLFSSNALETSHLEEQDVNAEVFNDSKVDSELCELCNRIDFVKLAHFRPLGGDVINSHYKYGRLSDLALRRNCKLCSFLWNEVCTRGLIPQSNARGLEYSFLYTVWQIKSYWHQDLLKDPTKKAPPSIITNQFHFVCHTRDDPPRLYNVDQPMLLALLPSTYPLPNVEQYGSRSDLELDDVKATKFSARLLPQTDTVDFKLCARWLRLCEHLHADGCMVDTVSEKEELPEGFTVIDVDEQCLVRAPSNCRYITLSYVWGVEPFVVATLANRLSLSTAGSLATVEIPMTVRDAMVVVKDMQERYLWVDALCITQDDEMLKAEHIQRMGAIYARSLLTIIGKDGENAYSGINGVSTSRGRIKQSVVYVKGLHMVATSPGRIHPSTWARRGWTCQEELLSRRQLVFTEEQVRWKCRKASWEESSVLEVDGILRKEFPLSLPITLEDDVDRARNAFWSTYQEIVRHYSSRQLRYTSDKLNAFRAIETSLSFSNEDQFVCGLPESCFTLALCWRGKALERNTSFYKVPVPGRGLRNQTFPSWSWCGWTGYVDYYDSPFTTTTFQYVDGNGLWISITERSVRHTLGCKTGETYSEKDYDPQEYSRSHLREKEPGEQFDLGSIQFLRFTTDGVKVVLVGPDTDPKWLGESLCFIEAESTTSYAHIRAECVIDSDKIYKAIATTSSQLWSTLCTGGIAKSNHEAVAIGTDSHGHTVCLIIEWRRDYAERIGIASIMEDDWRRCKKINKVIKLA